MRRLLPALALLPLPAFAQVAQEIDVDEIEYCLAEVGYTGPADPRRCIGFVADSCQDSGGAGSAADCMTREAAAWNEVAKRRVELLKQRSKQAVAEAVVASQDSWTRYRDAQCGATGEFFFQYSGSAAAEWQAKCLRDAAAERALLLDDWLTRSEDFVQ
ncbi:lysozyme inhibitor LprI family protein [Oricola thermophila]|uniref:DUF1311 domain-containing protein n=1 Tax=Oricola thermophila TaxID=2742145 RepID=A0A6N1VD96_9HYPH|nr:lysozyme inhibitor LprI family protein [Oricola thermophila]QKV17007.1 DUF1311 domain-containing protein [Oricola thermophila]